MQCLGEMSTWLPLPGATPYYAARYVDGALGFAIGWTVRQCPVFQPASPIPVLISAKELVRLRHHPRR